MFERMEITESIYEYVVEPSYKKTTWEDANRAGHSRQKRKEDASSWTRPEKGESSGKCIKLHVNSLTRKTKTCLIHGPDILQKNLRSWETSELSTLIVGLLKTAGATPYPGEKLTGSRKTTPPLIIEVSRGQRKGDDRTGEETSEMGLWRGTVGANRDLGRRLRSARQRVQNGRWWPAGWKLVWPGGPRPEQGWKIVCERAVQLSLRVEYGRGSQYTEGEGEGSRRKLTVGRGFNIRR